MSEERSQGVFIPGTHGHQGDEDLDARSLVKFTIGFLVAAVVIHVALGIMYEAFIARARRLDPPASPLAAERQPPPGPRLQKDPPLEMVQMRRDEARRLGAQGYGWVDREAGVAHIPIERAMELVVRGRRAAAVNVNAATRPAQQEEQR